MFVGVCRLTFHLHGVSSLKGKRQIMRRIIERTRGKFNVSAAEVSDNDVHRRGVVGFCAVANDRAHVDAVLSSVIRFADRLGVAPISAIETEVIPMKGDIGDSMPYSIDEWRIGNSAAAGDSAVDGDFEDEEELW